MTFQINFNPRSDKRSDTSILHTALDHCYFNPRSDERSDLYRRYALLPDGNFNPRSDERSDSDACAHGYLSFVFQSTLRRTEQPYVYTFLFSAPNFNPRSDERSDRCHICCRRRLYISIHAPTNGATCPFGVAWIGYNISIHAPTNGATNITKSALSHWYISIHAPTNGATVGATTLNNAMQFQSTLRRTERQDWTPYPIAT